MAKDDHTSVFFDREKLCFIGLQESHLNELKQTYKAIDVDSELKKMSMWLMTPKGKKRKGNIGFILNWLNNACPQGEVPTTTEQLNFFDYDSSLRPVLLDYLQDLWKGKEHILEFNKIRKNS